MTWILYYRQIWLVDFEFVQPDGHRPKPVCMVAREFHTKQTIRLWTDDLITLKQPPIPTGKDVLFVAYYASAEMSCYLALGWEFPLRVLDLFTEFRVLTSGKQTPCGAGLLGALTFYGLSCMQAVQKESLRQLIMGGGPYSDSEKQAILDYCESDVLALDQLLTAMTESIDLPRALIRGRYMAAVARMEWTGVPIDTDALAAFQKNWSLIKQNLISEIDKNYGVYEGMTFKTDRWEQWLESNNIPWPRLPSGQIALDDETFREAAKAHPLVAPIRELRSTISKLRLNELPVGPDGRNRCLISPFRSKTGRNQPSNSKFIFGPSAWLRSLIKPTAGRAIAYIDYSQQELAIAAALSGDKKMMEAYLSGDFYLTFAKMAGAVPLEATKESHAEERDQFKTVALGTLYGLSAEGLARKLNLPMWKGKELLRLHKETFSTFWQWSQSIGDEAVLTGRLQTVFGWAVHVENDPNTRSLRNFPMQGNGAEMMRLACSMATEAGISVCCPVHDAVLIEADLEEIEEAVAQMQSFMRKSSEMVLGDFSLKSDAKIVRFPDRYSDKRGVTMWNTICKLCGRAA